MPGPFVVVGVAGQTAEGTPGAFSENTAFVQGLAVLRAAETPKGRKNPADLTIASGFVTSPW